MANEESVLASPPTEEDAVHVRDYERFIRMFKIGAAVCFVVAIIVLMIL